MFFFTLEVTKIYGSVIVKPYLKYYKQISPLKNTYMTYVHTLLLIKSYSLFSFNNYFFIPHLSNTSPLIIFLSPSPAHPSPFLHVPFSLPSLLHPSLSFFQPNFSSSLVLSNCFLFPPDHFSTSVFPPSSLEPHSLLHRPSAPSPLPFLLP